MSDRRANLPKYKELVEELFHDRVKGKANPYTAVNGNMYSFLDDQGRICLRMSEEDRARFAEQFGTEPVVQYGSVMKGYVAIPSTQLSDPEELSESFMMSLEYAVSLPAK